MEIKLFRVVQLVLFTVKVKNITDIARNLICVQFSLRLQRATSLTDYPGLLQYFSSFSTFCGSSPPSDITHFVGLFVFALLWQANWFYKLVVLDWLLQFHQRDIVVIGTELVVFVSYDFSDADNHFSTYKENYCHRYKESWNRARLWKPER